MSQEIKFPYPCQIPFSESLRQIGDNDFEPEYGCDCKLADVHLRFILGYPNKAHVSGDIIACCITNCKYLK